MSTDIRTFKAYKKLRDSLEMMDGGPGSGRKPEGGSSQELAKPTLTKSLSDYQLQGIKSPKPDYVDSTIEDVSDNIVRQYLDDYNEVPSWEDFKNEFYYQLKDYMAGHDTEMEYVEHFAYQPNVMENAYKQAVKQMGY